MHKIHNTYRCICFCGTHKYSHFKKPYIEKSYDDVLMCRYIYKMHPSHTPVRNFGRGRGDSIRVSFSRDYFLRKPAAAKFDFGWYIVSWERLKFVRKCWQMPLTPFHVHTTMATCRYSSNLVWYQRSKHGSVPPSTKNHLALRPIPLPKYIHASSKNRRHDRERTTLPECRPIFEEERLHTYQSAS